MEEFINHYLSKSNTADTKPMINNIRRIERLLDTPITSWSVPLFDDDLNIICELNSKYSYNTAICSIHGILVWLDWKSAGTTLINKYREYMNDYIEIRNIKTYNKVVNFENDVEYPALRTMVLNKSTHFLGGSHAFTKFRNFLILALYTLMAPVRLGNFIDMKYLKQGEDPAILPRTSNYIIRMVDGDYLFVFNKYRTSRTNGQIIYKPEEVVLQRLIKKWFANYSKNQHYFLVNTSGESISHNNLTNSLSSISQKLFNKNITINTIRDSFIADFLKKENTLKERKRIFKLIGCVYKPSQNDLYLRV